MNWRDSYNNVRGTEYVKIPARDYEDHDDCLRAASDDYAAKHGLQGWDLMPGWEDARTRDFIILHVPTSHAKAFGPLPKTKTKNEVVS